MRFMHICMHCLEDFLCSATTLRFMFEVFFTVKNDQYIVMKCKIRSYIFTSGV